jgi:hypothetical protein
MATFQMSILNHSLNFDSGVYPSTMAAEMSLTNSKATQVIVLPYPTGSDLGLMGVFTLPQNYVGSPVFVARYIIDGTPANTLGVAAQQITVAAAATADVAYETEDTASNATWTGYADEEVASISVTITPTATYTAGNQVWWYFYRDDSVDDTTWNALLVDLIFQYADA